MAVLSIVTVRVKPGRMADFVAGMKELREIENRLGSNLRSMRLFEARVGGPEPGLVSVVFEYDDLASWGATVDAELRDRAFQTLTGSSADDADELVNQTLYVEAAL